MNWHTRAAIDGAKAIIPLQAPLRRWKRQVFPYSTDGSNDAGLLSDGIRQIEGMRRLGIDVTGKQVIEIGPGWYPILPLVYRMAGAHRVTMVDQERLMDIETARYAATYIAKRFTERAASLHADTANYRSLRGDFQMSRLDDTLRSAGLIYVAPADFRDLPDASADIIVSRNVLEHVSEGRLTDLTLHARRILRKGGIVCHTIDMSDHWSHKDKSISTVNFLRYEDSVWRWTCINKQNVQNRLRRFEYLRIFANAGFTLREATGEPDQNALATLATLSPLCRRYATVPHEELAVLETTVIADKP